jgi:hypothetical protein
MLRQNPLQAGQIDFVKLQGGDASDRAPIIVLCTMQPVVVSIILGWRDAMS